MLPRSRARFDPTISLGHLITLGSVIGGWWVSDYRLAALERLPDVIVIQAVTADPVNSLSSDHLERRQP